MLEKFKDNTTNKFWLLVLIFVSILLLSKISQAYSKYITNATGSMDATVAKWKLLITNGSGNYSQIVTPVLLNGNNVKNNTIAPGSKGYFDIIIDPTQTEVAFKFKVDFTYTNTNVGDFKPVRYKMVESNSTTALGTASVNDFTSTDSSFHNITGDSIPFIDKLYTGTAFTKIQIRVYFMWVEGTGETMDDTADTAVGNQNTTQYGRIQVGVYAEQLFEASEVTPDIPTVETVSFSSDSWSTIIGAVGSGNVSSYHVGDTKSVNMDSLGTHTIRIANMSNPSECSGTNFSQTACGFVIEFTDIITTHNMNSSGTSANGYPGSSMYTYLNSTVYNALPSDLKNAIITTKVISGNPQNNSGTGPNGTYVSNDKLYLLDSKEVYGTSLDSQTYCYISSKSYERQLDYYNSLGTTASNYSGAIKKLNGTNTGWWQRSPSSSDATGFYHTDNTGNWYYSTANTNLGVSPAFRIA